MRTVEREKIIIPPDRQRTEFSPAEINSLRDSILSPSGLLHPIVCALVGDTYILVAGERRLKAIDKIAEMGTFFLCDARPFNPGEVPVILFTNTDELSRKQAEFEENILREDLSWQDRIRAIDAIHKLRVVQEAADDEEQTVSDTARELAEAGGLAAGPKSIGGIRAAISEASIIAQHLNDPQIAKARTASEAFALILERNERAFNAALYAQSGTISSDVVIRHGSLTDILPTLAPEIYDLIIADPPYGINAGSDGARARTVHHHNYEDTPEVAKELATIIFLEGFRVTKSRSNLFMFCDIDLFHYLRDLASRAGWTCFRTPITWQKSESEGLAPWGASGFRRTCEWILYATKGEKGLLHSPTDILGVPRVAREAREYAAEKPFELMRKLIECSTLPGDTVLDPCCGSGVVLQAAKYLRRTGLGIELDKAAFDIAFTRIQEQAEKDSLSKPGEPDLEQL